MLGDGGLMRAGYQVVGWGVFEAINRKLENGAQTAIRRAGSSQGTCALPHPNAVILPEDLRYGDTMSIEGDPRGAWRRY